MAKIAIDNYKNLMSCSDSIKTACTAPSKIYNDKKRQELEECSKKFGNIRKDSESKKNPFISKRFTHSLFRLSNKQYCC